MMHFIALATLIIAGKSMVTTHAQCGGTYIAPAQACCNDIRYSPATESCCNGIVITGSCADAAGISQFPLPAGPRLIIRSNQVYAVDADVEDVFDEGDIGDDTGDDFEVDFDDEGDDEVDDEVDDGTDDDVDGTESTDDDVDGDTDTNSADDEDDVVDDDDDDESGVSASGSGDDDNSLESVDGGDEETGSSREYDYEGALFDRNGNQIGYSSSSASNEMDYYVKLTLINMWIILGLIIVVNIIFYYCYCRRHNARFSGGVKKVASNSMFVDGQIITDEDIDERGTDAV